MISLHPLHPRHADELLAGQDDLLAQEIIGRRRDRADLEDFLRRAARWRPDGPIREFAALTGGPRAAEGAGTDETAGHGVRSGQLIGGGGLALLGAGLERGQAALTYWVLAAHRGRGHGHSIASALVEHARVEPRIRELALRIAPDNHASQAVARGLGARPTGQVEHHPTGASRTAGRWILELA